MCGVMCLDWGMHFSTRHPQQQFESLGPELFISLRDSSGVSHDVFMKRFLVPIERMSLLIQDLPLERDSFAGVTGALKFGLTSALIALRLCDSTIFVPSASSRLRAEVEPQYRYCAFLGALASVPILVDHYVDVRVGDAPWSLTSGQYLFDKAKDDGYDVAWKAPTTHRPSSAQGIVLLSKIFQPGDFAHLNPEVVNALCEAINPACVQRVAESALAKIVRVAQEKARSSDKERTALEYARVHAASAPVLATVSPAGDETAPNPTSDPIRSEPVAAQGGATNQGPDKIQSNEICDWVKAVALTCPSEISFFDESKVKVTRKALNFGVQASVMFQKIYAENLVITKLEDGFVGSPLLTTEFRKYLKA